MIRSIGSLVDYSPSWRERSPRLTVRVDERGVAMLHAGLRGFRRRWVFIASLVALVGATVAIGQSQIARRTWSDYGGGPDSAKYMTLTQITKDNVSALQPA